MKTKFYLTVGIIIVLAMEGWGQEHRISKSLTIGKMGEAKFKKSAKKHGIAGALELTIAGSLDSLQVILNDLSSIRANSNDDGVHWIEDHYEGRVGELKIDKLVPLEPQNSRQRYYLEGKQGVKHWPLVSSKGAALFEVRLLTEVLQNSSEGVTEIIVDIKYWILVYDTRKLRIMRAKRKWDKKYTNLGYDDPVEAELVEKLKRLFKKIGRQIN
jgi:hypothetical protein